MGTGLGPFEPYGTATAVQPRTLAARDLDADGDVDVAAGIAAGDVLAFQNDGTGELLTPTTVPGVGAEPRGLAIADFDRDGGPDLAAASATAQRVAIARARGEAVLRSTIEMGSVVVGQTPRRCRCTWSTAARRP